MSADEPELVYRFSELSDRARDRVRDWATGDSWDRGDQYLASLRALAEHFGGKLTNWNIDWSGNYSHSTAEFEMPEDYQFIPDMSSAEGENGDLDEGAVAALRQQEIRRRLAELGDYDPDTLRGRGDCALTGWCYDESAIEGFRRAFFEGETDLGALMEQAFRSLLKDARNNFEYDHSDRGVAESCEVNDYWFDEDGRLADPPDRSAGRYSKTQRDLTEKSTVPHARCAPGNCVEHARDKRVYRCELGRGPKPARSKSGRSGSARGLNRGRK